MDFDPVIYVIIVTVYFFAGWVKGAIGFGLPTIAMGLMSLAIAPPLAAALIVVPTMVTNIWQMSAGPDLPALLRRFWPMLLCIVLGTLLTAGIITGGNTRLTTAILGGVLIAYGLTGLLGRRFHTARKSEPVMGPAVGLVTGFLNGATAVSVVPSILYVESTDLEKDDLVQAFALSAFTSTVALGLGLGVNSGLGLDIAIPALVAVAAALIGMAVGQRVRSKLSVAVFRRWVLVGLAALGGIMIARAVL